MKIFYANQCLTSTITAYSEQPTYPVSTALLDTRLSRYCRTINDNSEWIVFDLGSAKAITDLFILGHNLTAGATVVLQGNASNSWGAPSFTQAVTIADNIWTTFAIKTYRYWRLTFADASNPDTFIQLAYVYLGTALTMPGMDPGQKVPRVTTADVTDSVTGQAYGTKNIQYRTATVSFPSINDADKKLIDAFFVANDIVQPFIMAIWESDLTIEPLIYCRLTGAPAWQKQAGTGLQWSVEFSFKECF